MMKCAIGLFTLSLAGLSCYPASAATAIARDAQGVVYRVTRASLEDAFPDVIEFCYNSGGRDCEVIATNHASGYGAVAQSPSRIGAAMGYRSQEAARQAALASCARRTPANEVCSIVLKFRDRNN